MRIVHRVGLRANAAQLFELEALGIIVPGGITLPGGGDSLVTFEVDEDHPNWQALASLLRRWHASDVTRSEFTRSEIDSAPWLEVAAWHHGYPQPDEGNFGYREATYDLSDWCEKCGIGMKQRAPFQMKREPRWGRNAIMQLVWVYGELFVTREAWSEVFRPASVACRPVLDTRGAELRTVVQLVVDTTVNIVPDDLAAERCERCDRTKYLPVTRGPFPALRGAPAVGMARTAEYFGSGAQAHQPVLISQEVLRALTAGGVRGASLKPVAHRCD